MKRFTETEKWTRNPWFRKLSPRLKCLWMLLCESCDAAGVVKVDWEMASFQIGEEVSEADLNLMDGRVVRLDNGKWWIIKFIEFQYGHLSPTCKPHNQVFKSIEANSIPYPYPLEENSKGIHTLKEEDKDKDKDKNSLEGVQGETVTPQQIVDAYPRRQDVATALQIVAKAIAGGQEPVAMLAGTRAIASAISQLPSASLNAYVPSAASFFRADRWKDDPATWLRHAGNKTGSTAAPSLGGRKALSTTKV